jgi:hypothetical protein
MLDEEQSTTQRRVEDFFLLFSRTLKWLSSGRVGVRKVVQKHA